MTRIIITMLAIILSLLTHAQEAKETIENSESGITISVTVPKIVTNKGKVYFALYDSEAGFAKREFLQSAAGEIAEGSTEIQFTNVPKGFYAITCYHDANSNQQLDFDGYMPVEDYGSSNNPQAFGPPQFKASMFEVMESDLSLEIRF